MIEASWIYDLVVCLYALSILFYFFDFLHQDYRANRAALLLLTLVWVFQTVFFVLQVTSKNYLPILTQFETLFFYSWLLVTISLLVNAFFRIDLFVFFSNVVGFALIVLSLFSNPNVSPTVSEQLTSDLMWIHVTLAFLAYAAFSISGIFSLMYLILNRNLKEKRWTPTLRRLTSLDQMEHYAYRITALGVPLLLLSLILGVIWAVIAGIEAVWWDPKVSMSLFVLLVYSTVIYGKAVRGWYGRKLATRNLWGFAAMIANYLVAGHISVFHQWF